MNERTRAAMLAPSRPCARSTSSFVAARRHTIDADQRHARRRVRARTPRARAAPRPPGRPATSGCRGRRSARRRDARASQAPSTSRSHGSAITPQPSSSSHAAHAWDETTPAPCTRTCRVARRGAPCRGPAPSSRGGRLEAERPRRRHEADVDGPRASSTAQSTRRRASCSQYGSISRHAGDGAHRGDVAHRSDASGRGRPARCRRASRGR